jgi:integrase
MDEITAKLVAEYRTARLSEKAKSKLTNVSPSTVNREIELLRSMFNRAVEWGDALTNPVKNDLITSEKDYERTRYLNNNEAKKLYDVLDGHLKPVVIVTTNAGLRLREALNLKWRDCNFERRLINIVKSKTGKKLLPMNNIVYNILVAWPRYEKSEYIFCHKDDKWDGKPFYDVRTAWKNALKKAGIEDFRFHDLRHTFASQLLMSGVDMKTVSELLGHSSMRMTERYTHLSEAHKQRGVDLLGQNFGFGTATKTATINIDTVDKFLEESQVAVNK